MEKIMSKRQRTQIFITIFWFAVLIGGVYVYLSSRNELNEAISYLQGMKVSYLLLLIPVIALMYYEAGGIWYPYLKYAGLSRRELGGIQYELNFVNTVVPFFSVLTGLVYAQKRLEKYDISKTESGMLYAFRYYVSIATKWIEIAMAMSVLAVLGKTGEMPTWAVWATCILVTVILAGLALVLVLFLKKVRVPEKLLRSPRWGEKAAGVDAKLEEVFQILSYIFKEKGALFESFAWGIGYSFLEIIPFWVVAAAMGHPELLLQIIVASGIGMTVGVFTPTPMGIGGFDGAMILFMGSLDPSNIALTSAIVITAHALTMAGTAITGIPFWMRGMRQIGEEN